MAESEDVATHKRKATPELTEEDTAGKRLKLDDGNEDVPNLNAHATEPEPEREPGARRSPEARRPSASGGPPIRRAVSLEEKKRGQRLFGGLVSTLSRTTAGSQQQRRLEIERRQHEKAQQRRAEDEKRRAERLAQLKRTRQIEQIKLEEQAYYIPWELTKEQEETIKEQIRAAEDMIDRETREFRSLKERRLRALGVSPPPRSPSPPPRQQGQQEQQEQQGQQGQRPKSEPDSDSRAERATVGEPQPSPQDTNREDAVAATPSKVLRGDHHDKDHDENGDEMMQDEEDIVIY
ncbi:uncharacterized protein THITE_155901 [Thermothielavioides terrestris NRRL 8126]|uniref:Pinin/SDK/MemA protein domain-containing protein n=1 Tax=Thermothielavioides terrestris (strain ATCC 38088 / NRRL 8126) TaxID=578455 RepID=G2RBS7_THETT|nr:uncharacterized protein THITE_155901 [Thermothielavioides terrestris NRRL 8126]AEO69248.1 hypothetical protein THITE_155901 [Thermothielavioides terrestris NRRL 8126]